MRTTVLVVALGLYAACFCDICSMHEPIIPRGARQSKSQLKRTCSIFAYEDIREVHKRRYLLQPMAVEVFSGDGRNYLLAFQKGVRNKVYQRYCKH